MQTLGTPCVGAHLSEDAMAVAWRMGQTHCTHPLIQLAVPELVTLTDHPEVVMVKLL